MSATHVFRVKDVCARLHVNLTIENSASASSKESGPKSGTGAPLKSPFRSDSTRTPRLQSPLEARWDQEVAQSTWQTPASPVIPSPSPLDLVYGRWSTCISDGQESRIALPLESSLDGDIFGVGKRPVQHEIEKDGCIRLVFVEE